MSVGQRLVVNDFVGVGIIEYRNASSPEISGACAMIEGAMVSEDGVLIPGISRLYLGEDSLDELIKDLTDARESLRTGDFESFSHVTDEDSTNE